MQKRNIYLQLMFLNSEDYVRKNSLPIRLSNIFQATEYLAATLQSNKLRSLFAGLP